MLVFVVLLRLEGNGSIINVLDEECKTGLVIIVFIFTIQTFPGTVCVADKSHALS